MEKPRGIDILQLIDRNKVRLRSPEQIGAVRSALDTIIASDQAALGEQDITPGWEQELPRKIREPFVLLEQRSRFDGRVEALQVALGSDDSELLSDIESVGTNPLHTAPASLQPPSAQPRSDEALLHAIGALSAAQIERDRQGAKALPTSTREWISALEHPSLTKRYPKLKEKVSISLRAARNSGRDEGLGYALGEEKNRIAELVEKRKQALPRQRPPTR